jgi:hypothetical protein
MTHASSLAADAFAAALTAIPAEDWDRTWAADRTIMLRMTSKRVKEAVSKLRPPAVVKVSKAFREDARNGTAAERLQHILGQLEKLSSKCRITGLDLSSCCISGQDEDKLAEVLALCPGLVTLDLGGNQIRVEGAGRLAGVLPQFASLSELYLGGNQIRVEGAGRLAGVLPLCPMLSFLDLHGNQIAAEAKLILRAAWSGEPLNLLLGEAGAGELCPLLLLYCCFTTGNRPHSR